MKSLNVIPVLVLTVLIGFTQNINAQEQYADSLKQAYISAKEDSSKVFVLQKLAAYYSFVYPDSALSYAERIIEISKKQNYAYGEALGNLSKADAFDRIADFTSALEATYNCLTIAQNLGEHKLDVTAKALNMMGHLNHMTGNEKQSVAFLHQSIDFFNQSGERKEPVYYTYFQLAFSLFNYDKIDSAFFYLNKGKEFLHLLKPFRREPSAWLITGNLYLSVEKNDSAEKYFREGLAISKEYNSLFITAILYNSLGYVFKVNNQKDSAIYYMRQSLLLSRKYHFKVFEMESSGQLADIYDGVNADSTLKYLKLMLYAKDEVSNDAKTRQFQQVAFEHEKQQKAAEDAKVKLRNQLRTYALLIALGVFLIIAFIFWRNNRQKRIANILLQKEKEKVEETLQELKSTQSQLIQSEKMASLGQLTAGIAHEIQNPLNFVNNFSDVNKELLAEMNDEIDKGNMDEVKAIATDVIENEEKINHHGKRADSIVKGMLQHSRSSSGQKEPTDINALADEYLRLSYHGLRAKDKSFNAAMKTDYDETIGSINIIPQDIGRVLLNLYTNAFYAVKQRADRSQGSSQYEPTVSITTKKIGIGVEIQVKDNGEGIPQNIVDKIFQPFFTTKPTGKGTGLGLSLSYDIVKAHGGTLTVKTKEDEGLPAEALAKEGPVFIIQLPVS